MQLDSLVAAALATIASIVGLWWHFKQARAGKATTRDRAMGGLWAAMLVLAGGRVLWLLTHPQETTPGAAPAEQAPAPADPAKTK